jgi:hypothetical protein
MPYQFIEREINEKECMVYVNKNELITFCERFNIKYNFDSNCVDT